MANDMQRLQFVGELRREGKGWLACSLFDDAQRPIEQLPSGAGAGDLVLVQRSDGKIEKRLAPAGSALAKMYTIAAEHALDPVFPAAVVAEVQAILESPGVDDPTLVDLSSLPFVTIDGPGTRDLDQAVFVERDGKHWRVDYALADPAWCVRPGTALWDEAMRRGASYYLPGLAIPMLPRALSEGVVSLNEDADRRATVLRMYVDAKGHCARTEIVRARMRSRAQLTFEDVQRFLDGANDTNVPADAGDSMRGLREVGVLRMRDAQRRDVIRYRRTEIDVKVGKSSMRFVVIGGVRSQVELYNEQLSLMCNVEGARFLREGDEDNDEVQPIFRVHPRPDPRRMEEFEKLLDALCRRHDLDRKRWAWKRGGDKSLAEFLLDLPYKGKEGRIAKAIHRQAVLTNVRSTFSDEPSRHHGVGADVYARFSAPMREIVGVFLHKETFEKLESHGAAPSPDDDALRAQIVERANQSKQLQKRITKEANRLVLDQLFADDIKRPPQERPLRQGTVMGLTRGKAHVLLDNPCVEVKVYTRHQEQISKGRLDLSEDGTQLEHADGRPLCRIGDGVRVRLHDRDKRGDRWMATLVE